MDFLDSNSSSSQFCRSSFSRSFSVAVEEVISSSKLTEQCNKLSIDIIQLPDKRLQTGLNFVGLKAKYKNVNQTIVIFITGYKQKQIVVTAYNDGKKVEKNTLKSQSQLPRLIKKWLDSCKPNKQNQNINSVSIIQKLNTKCAELIKSQKNQLVAMQKLKTTKQYRTLIEHHIQISVQVQSLSQSLIQTQRKLQKQNDSLIGKILDIQRLKNQIEQLQYEHEQLCRYLRHAKQNIHLFVEVQRKKVDSIQIQSESKLNEFIFQATKLKKLELQKRFLL